MRSMEMNGPDGTRWLVFRRRVAWRPWLPGWTAGLGGFGGGSDVELYLWLLFLAVVIPIWLWYLLSWVLSLIATPFVAHERKARRRPTPVIARRTTDKRAEYTGQADGFDDAGRFVAHVAREIQAYGEPRSLTPPPAKGRKKREHSTR